MRIKILLLTVFVSFLTGCMSSKPSESDGRKVLRDYLTTKAKITSFTKMNGKEDGENGYIMYFKAEITYPEGLNTKCLEKNLPKVIANGVVIGKDRSRCISFSGQVKAMDIGEKETIKRKIYFEKTENGWIGRVSDRYGF